GVLAGVVANGSRREAVEGDLIFALSDQVGRGDFCVAEQVERERINPDRAAGRVGYEAGDHAVEIEPANVDARVPQDADVKLRVLTALSNLGVGKDWRELPAHDFERDRAAEPERRNVVAAARLERDADSDEVGIHRGEARRLGVEGEKSD